VARLKFKNIQDDAIIITRSKTENSSGKNLKPIIITLLPDAKRIIAKWGNLQNPENYIFPIYPVFDAPEADVYGVASFRSTT
jgi:hypothetical protein